MGVAGPVDRAWARGADRRWCLLCAVGMGFAVPDFGNRLPGGELVWRQPGWNGGESSTGAASAVRVLCGPHDRQLRVAGVDGRTGAIGIHASGDRDWIADWISAVVDPVVPGDIHDGRVSFVVLAIWADRVASPAGH